VRVARFLQQYLHDELDGIVILHGTDALEEVAYFVDEVFSPRISLVFTGAMRPGWADDFDGLRNVENAFRLAAVAAAEYGALVTMHGAIFEAWSVYKADTAALDAFTSRRGSASGRIQDTHIDLPWRPVSRQRFAVVPPTLPTSVPILTLGVGDDGGLLGCVDAGVVQGLVVAGMGAGSVPPLVQEKMLTLARQGIPIILCSSSPSGPTAVEQYYPGDYEEMRSAGIVIEDRLNARKTRIRLLLSLGLGRTYTPFAA
jgi:L-asparaginase